MTKVKYQSERKMHSRKQIMIHKTIDLVIDILSLLSSYYINCKKTLNIPKG